MIPADFPKSLTAQGLAFDPVLPPAGTPEPVVQDENGIFYLQIFAPGAQKVQAVSRDNTLHFRKEENGCWRAALPFQEGIHYVTLMVDGALWLTPYLPIAYGYSRPCNVIVLPEKNDAFYELRNVPHGKVVRELFYSSVTESWERCFVYTPPAYEMNPDAVFPVLYLQHGHGENETGWITSGKLPLILDNLLHDGKCEPFLVVMNNGMVQKMMNGKRVVDFTLFEEYLTKDVIPFIENRYRAGGSKAKRAMAGLSMGSLQTSMTGFRHPELFSALGIFSGFLHDWISGSELDMTGQGPGDDSHLSFLNDKEAFDAAFDVFFRAMGKDDPFFDKFEADDLLCKKAGIRQIRKIYSGTHDWNTWRQCILDFAQLIF